MPELLLVPEVAAGATEVVVADWLVEPGADFTAGDAIAVIETDKAVLEMEAPQSGTLLRALVGPGATIEVGLPMALVGSSSDVGTDLDATLARLGVGTVSAADASQEPDAPTSDPVEVAQATEEGADSVAVEPVATDRSAGGPGGRVFISPIARKLLREAGLTPDGLVGSGPGGRIRRRDVERLIADRRAATPDAPSEASAPTSTQVASADAWTDVPHTRLRRTIARRLTESKQHIPHFYVKRSVTLDPLLELRRQLIESSGAKFSVNDFVIRAVASAHQQVPDANVIWTEDALRRFDHVDISVAIAAERGLVTPVLRDVGASSLSAISRQVKTYVEQAGAGTLQQRDLEGGSITISNLGMYGVDEFSAIINPPQSAILAVGAGRPAAVVVDDQVVVRTVSEMVLSADHRAIDGALAAQWMSALVHALHHPLTLLV
ncbi:putative pyruvate dehydrogenase complex dihydrolipoamide acetyltransferase [Aeromicrobium marinum DSM 15272]|uniref:Dihydrolipoamide acetyltransferase component of pyruvate dehydrogenase complex n=1 Tax=Aeromicrobium marinum DSM 15272 TaxID=585531 RepID=E2SAS0_9ACTN|nr:dihydrolipoamide acetyltransferase family protein [Aeromicrobium marinum]EFQ83466.1 putative pyruvate dehydrogenase complex dihydrolipoamide acetyltransferase [Aeromicrobium marinum DSM 15272]